MTALLIANMAPLMFCGADRHAADRLSRSPSRSAPSASLFGLLGIELGLLDTSLLQALPERVFGVMSNDTLLAVPFFTFMGLILERCGMAEDLLDTIGQLFGPLRGGLAYAVDLRRRAARGDDRRRRRERHLDGPDLAADHAALRLRPPARDRRHRRIGHARADHPAVARADHHGRPARPLGRRHVRGRVHSRASRSPASTRSTCSARRSSSRTGRRRCRRKRGRCASRTAAAAHRRCSCSIVIARRVARSLYAKLRMAGSRARRAARHRDERRHRRRVLRRGAEPRASSSACCRRSPSASCSC